MYKSFILLLSILCLTNLTTLQAQEEIPKEDVVYFKNGSIIRGTILEYEPEGNIKIEIQGGSILVYKTSEITKVQKEPMKNPPKPDNYQPRKKKSPPILKTEGMYNFMNGGNLFGINDWGSPSVGFTFNYSAGYQINNYLAVGAGLGFTTLFSQYNFVPVYADIRGYLFKKPTSLYYNIEIGYNAALKTQTWEFPETTKAEGGIYFRPAIGWRIGSRKRTNFMIDIGFTIMSAKYSYIDWNDNPVLENRTFYRTSIRCGMLF